MKSFFRKLQLLMRQTDKEAEIQDELQFHLSEEVEERQAEGLMIEEARHAARRHLGNLTLAKEDTRAVWTWIFAEQIIQDVRYGLRTMAANKTFCAMALLSLALGIGQHRHLQLHECHTLAPAAGNGSAVACDPQLAYSEARVSRDKPAQQ